MAYFKINNIDFSMYVNELNVNKTHLYNAQSNASGNTVVDYLRAKTEIEVGIIPLNSEDIKALLSAIDNFEVSITYLNPLNNELKTIDCIIPSENVSYYTIRADKVLVKGFKLKFMEL